MFASYAPLLYAYLAEKAVSARVLIVGCRTGEGLAQLARHASSVVAIDTSSVSLSQAQRTVSLNPVRYELLEHDTLPAETEPFDLIVIPELARFSAPETIFVQAVNLLSPSGWICCAIADRVDAYDLLQELMSRHFAYRRFIAALPFYGSILADFSPEGDLEPVVDQTLVDANQDSSPFAYLAIGSAEPINYLGYALIQLPESAFHRATPQSSMIDSSSTTHSILQDVTRLEAAEARNAILTRKLDQQSVEIETLRRTLAELQALRDADAWKMQELTGQLRELEKS